MAEPSLLQQARESLDRARDYPGTEAGNTRLAVKCILQYLEQREANMRGPAQKPGETSSTTPSVCCPTFADALDLDELQRLCDSATPGPWESETGCVWVELDERTMPSGKPRWRCICEVDNGSSVDVPDARFIAAARTALPKLIAQVRELRANVPPLQEWARGERQELIVTIMKLRDELKQTRREGGDHAR